MRLPNTYSRGWCNIASYQIPSTGTRRGSGSRNNPNQYPYANTAFGQPHPLPRVPAAAPPTPALQPLQMGAARPSWDLAGILALTGAYAHIPIREDYALNAKLRESIPLIDAAILRMKDLIGFPEIEAAPRLKRDIDNFLRDVPVNRVQQGAPTWLRSHLDNAYTYGRSHTEILLTADGRDVFGLVEVFTPTCAFRPTRPGFALDVVQYQYGGGAPIALVPELLLTSVHDFRGDDPNGNSLIASLPFVTQILIRMFDSMRQQWERFGVPNYHVNWEPPESWNDPSGDLTSNILAPMKTELYESDVDRSNGRVRHFWTSGKITVDAMGMGGDKVLEFSETAKEFAQQILAKTGIPPFMLGLSWSTTERMSTAQAKLLTEVIEAGRYMVEPGLRKLIDLRQRLVGRTGRFELHWPKVSLVDMIDVSRSAWMDAQASSISLANWQEKVRLGINSLEEMAIEFRDDMEGIKPSEVRELLNGQEGMPQLEDKIPDPVPVQVAGMRQQGGDPPGGNSPRDESTPDGKQAFWDHEIKPLVTNGNGKH